MRGKARHVVAFALCCASACGTGDVSIDPGELELRDLLGVAPEVAGSWDVDQRASARAVLVDALADTSNPIPIELANGASLDERVTRGLQRIDDNRFAAGKRALALVRVELDAGRLVERAAPSAVAATGGAQPPVLALDTQTWGTLAPEAIGVLAGLASDAGHEDGTLAVVPAPRLPAIASYVAGEPPRLLVNPVLVASLDPAFVTTTTARTTTATTRVDTPLPVTAPSSLAGGNPYSFYGSINECAYAQRLRCESCLASNNCTPVTSSTDGNAECTTLAANDGRGYFLLCVNLALAITSVDACAEDTVSGCARDTDAASDLGQLEANANFVDDTTCASGLDSCLAKIYGEPDDSFPGIVDGGTSPPPQPPRNTEVSCGDSCSDSNNNCDASPSCNCEGPSCNNSFSCDSTCSSSNNQSGCGDNCDSCSSDSGGSSSDSGGSCGGDSGGDSGGGCGGDCGGGDCGGDCGSSGGGGGGGGSSGGGCGGDSGGCGGDSGGCGGSGGGGCGGGGGGDSCGGGGGGGGSCQVVKRTPSAGFALALSLMWGALPIPFAAFMRRRGRRRSRARTADANANPCPDEAAARDDEVVQ